MATATGWASIHITPTVGLPATAARPALRINPLTGTTPITELKADTSTTTALSGGTDTGVTLGLPANSRWSIPVGLILGPGAVYGLSIPFTTGVDVSLSVYTVEEAI